MANPLQLAGAQSIKQPRFSPIWNNRFLTGIWLQRSPLRDPSTRIEAAYYGGRQEALIAGVNIELTNALTLTRRPGNSQYSLQTVSEPVNSFYSFRSFTTLSETIQVMMDGLTQIYTLTPAAITSIYYKSMGAGQSSFLGINNTLYIGDGIDQRAWPAFTPNSAAVTNTSLVSTVATYDAVNTFSVGRLVTVTGTTNGGGVFNVINQPITAASGTQFQIFINSADVGGAADTGTATLDQTRNWGISTGGVTVSSAFAGTGASGSLTAGMATAASKAPTAGANGLAGPNGTEFWANSGSITNLDGSYATADLFTLDHEPGPDGSNYLNATNFNFNIPAGSTITGVAASAYVGAFTVSGFTSGGVRTDSILLLKAGVQAGTGFNTGSWPSGFITPLNYGSSSNLWGAALTAADVNDPGFGVALSCVMSGPGGSLGRAMTAAVDYVFITVYYTLPGAPSWVNPTNIQGAPDGAYTTAVTSNGAQTAALTASNFGFGTTGTVVGVQVNLTGHVSSATSGTVLYAQLQDNNGNPIGVQKLQTVSNTTDTAITFGGSTDVWVAALNSAIVNNSSFGVRIIASGTGQTFFIDSCQIQLYVSQVSAVVSGSVGTFNATTGYKYVYEYSNSTAVAPPFSSATPPTVTTGPIVNKLNVGVSVVASTDPQVNSIWVFRTTDGGNTYLALPTNPYPNTTTTITDNASDSALIVTQLADLTGLNTPPPAGISGMVFHMGRMWGFANNVLYYAVGPDLGNVLGSPYEGWPRANFFTFPSKVTKLIPTSVGLLVFTISDVYIIYGNASATAAATGVSGLNVFYAAPFITEVGLLSQFAADVNGTTIYMLTADGQMLSIDPSSGVSEIGFPIGVPNIAYPNDPSIASYDPATSYVTWHVAGSQDKALYMSDGSTGWFRCNTSQPPEGGFVWSPKANIVGGCGPVQSIETSPGRRQLLIGPNGLPQLSVPTLGFPVGSLPAGSIPAGMYYFVVTALDISGGETTVSNEVSLNFAGPGTTGVALAYTGDSRTTTYRIWYGTSPGGENFYFETTNPSAFTVTALNGTAGTLPVSNTTSFGANHILVRDLNMYADGGITYPSNCTMGSIVLAYPGQIAEIDFITCDYNRIGTSPVVSVLMNEISGAFSSVSGYVHSDPPSLYGTTLSPATLYANRHDFAQTVAFGPPNPIFCRHLQIKVDFGSTDAVKNELMTMTIYGSFYAEK